MSLSADEWIEHLDLTAHPEGGYYKQVYKADESISKEALPKRFIADRVFSTSIYFLLKDDEVSRFHRILSDELWFFHAGSALSVYIILDTGELQSFTLGSNSSAGEVFQAVVPAGCWFGAALDVKTSFALVSCVVAPGFEFEDFELANREDLLKVYPQHKNLIHKLT